MSKRMTDEEALRLEGVLRPLIRSLRRNMKLVMGEDDLTQTCLVRLLMSSQSEWGDSYVKRLARNVCIDQARTEKAEKKALFGLPQPEEANSDEEAEKWLNYLLEGCSWEVKKTVRLKMAGFSDEEIATQTGMDRRVVRSTLLKVANFVENNYGR